MAEPFTGFPAAGLEFLDELGRSDKTWFDRHRSIYAESVVAPTKAFVVALGEIGFASGAAIASAARLRALVDADGTGASLANIFEPARRGATCPGHRWRRPQASAQAVPRRSPPP
ncbi:MAG: hypothetical protein R2754_00900 [Microthrixaceae bacterium]